MKSSSSGRVNCADKGLITGEGRVCPFVSTAFGNDSAFPFTRLDAKLPGGFGRGLTEPGCPGSAVNGDDDASIFPKKLASSSPGSGVTSRSVTGDGSGSATTEGDGSDTAEGATSSSGMEFLAP